MYIRLAREIARPQMFAIMDLLKRSTGMPVGQLAAELDMSYMGIKQHCLEMEKKGLVETWRNPKAVGRPEKLYRLTDKEVGNELTMDILDSVKELYGGGAPEKLLFSYFGKKTEAYVAKIKGATLSERVKQFAKLRDQEGCCAQVEADKAGNISIVEYHSPLRQIAQAYPSVLRMEELMYQRVLGGHVDRSEEKFAGLTKHIFRVPALTQALSA
jgi:predicted ArsR family transcriptional regulator